MSDICLSDLLFTIEKRRVDHSLAPMVMLRNYEGLPTTKPGNDIDLIVRSAELEGWKQSLKDAADEMGIQIGETLGDYYFRSYAFHDEGREILKIDLNFAFVWRGVEFADIDQIIDSANLHSAPIHVPQQAVDRAFVTFCHSFLYGGFIQQRYLTDFAAQLRDGTDFHGKLADLFGQNNADVLKDRILSGQSEMPRRQANAMRLMALARALLRQPFATVHGFVKALPGPTVRAG